MKNLFEGLIEAADSLAERWIDSLGLRGSGEISVDHAARAVKDLLGPLSVNGGGDGHLIDIAGEQARRGFESEYFNGCRALFSGRAREEVADSLSVLADAAVETIRGCEADKSDVDRASELLRGYFLGLGSAVLNVGDARGDSAVQLIKSNKLLHSLFQNSRNAVVFLNADKKIIDANKCAQKMFKRPLENFLGQSPKLMFSKDERDRIGEVVEALAEGESWEGEASAVRSGQEPFPAEVTITRVQMDDKRIYHLIIVDLSERERLKRDLEREREQIREMSVTLKNVIKSVDREKQDFIETLAHSVEIELMPALGRMSREESVEVRDDYREVIENQLRGLARGASGKLNSLMMKLTPTEIQICKYIQAGHGTKEISEMMNSSFETVQTHRKNIRKKLKLTGRQVSLATFLRTLPEQE